MIGLMILGAAALHSPVVVSISTGSPCHYAIDGMAMAEDELPDMLRRRRASTSHAVITYTPETPWRCMGAALTLLARARFHHVQYDPPLPKEGSHR